MDARRPQTHYPPPPPSSIDTRVPPPPPFAHPPPATSYAAPPPGPALPPIQHQPYGPPGAAPDQTNLPSFRHHSQPPQHSHEPPREPSEPYPYVPLRGSGHATPAPVNRTYSHDSAAQRTPTTPVQHPPYPPLAASEGAPPPQYMEHGPHHAYPITNGTHGPPPPNAPPPPPPPPHHEQHPQYMTPVLETAHGPYGPPPQPMTDKNMEKLLSLMESQSADMKSQSADMKYLNSKLDDMDARLKRLEKSESKASASASSHDNMDGDTMKRKETYGDHRTAPHKLLLLWPSVHPLLNAADINLGDGYVMEAEDRGILRLYTRGEGIDEHDGTQPGGPASPARSEESSGE
ncbi:hypothetical protein M433DRAFT_138224, partial [Acidomyces richmondensis BFW]